MYDHCPLMMSMPSIQMDYRQFTELKEHEKRDTANRMGMFENNQNLNYRVSNYDQFRDSIPKIDKQMPVESLHLREATPLPRQPGCGCSSGAVDYLLGYENNQEV